MTRLAMKKVDIAEYEYCYSVAMIQYALNHVGRIDFRAEK
ncbi:MAG: hypothetical protein GAK33_03163 [Burkholderia lata]|uniref:Uncharacterized protein n=1 Tax=Burkholderia lata (strain ATCC 17760 / DSM 23089 / LMG 22485 / NCIMB 9086 / R18194 / 383) TaxID=482957 RepID=A0A833PRN9_BURL3|nr:MAG: hypothetical protein GAK33_03163 [Burkholderia lata]